MSEIELILAKLRIVSEEKERGMYLCDKEHSKLLYDYITNLQQENKQLKEELEKIKQPTIFIDTQDMEERWGEQLYQDYLEKQNKELKDRIDKANDLIDTILTFNIFGNECPLDFGFEKDSLQEKAQKIFYENDGEYCEHNCDSCYKKCWLKFFKKIQILKGSDNNA